LQRLAARAIRIQGGSCGFFRGIAACSVRNSPDLWSSSHPCANLFNFCFEPDSSKHSGRRSESGCRQRTCKSSARSVANFLAGCHRARIKANLGLLLSRANVRVTRGQRWEELSALLLHVTTDPKNFLSHNRRSCHCFAEVVGPRVRPFRVPWQSRLDPALRPRSPQRPVT
jgi:hypothetical protein